MAGRVTITVKMGVPKGKRVVIHRPVSLVVGRADDCDFQVGVEGVDRLVSRHHCLIEVDPPHVWVSDLGSLNGTYLNGRAIGGRKGGPLTEAESPQEDGRRLVDDGDEIWIGMTILGVEIEAPVGVMSNRPPSTVSVA